MGQSARFKNSDSLSKVQAAHQQMGEGVPTTQMTDEKGKKKSSIATTEMLSIRQGDVPASAFTVPAGVEKRMMPDLDSLRAAQATAQAKGQPNDLVGAVAATSSAAGDVVGAAKQGAIEGVKEGAKHKAGKAIRGLFGRKS